MVTAGGDCGAAVMEDLLLTVVVVDVGGCGHGAYGGCWWL